MDKNPTLRDIVEGWLRDHDYDGFYHDACGCRIGKLWPCHSPYEECRAGYVCTIDDDGQLVDGIGPEKGA